MIAFKRLQVSCDMLHLRYCHLATCDVNEVVPTWLCWKYWNLFDQIFAFDSPFFIWFLLRFPWFLCKCAMGGGNLSLSQPYSTLWTAPGWCEHLRPSSFSSWHWCGAPWTFRSGTILITLHIAEALLSMFELNLLRLRWRHPTCQEIMLRQHGHPLSWYELRRWRTVLRCWNWTSKRHLQANLKKLEKRKQWTFGPLNVTVPTILIIISHYDIMRWYEVSFRNKNIRACWRVKTSKAWNWGAAAGIVAQPLGFGRVRMSCPRLFTHRLVLASGVTGWWWWWWWSKLQTEADLEEGEEVQLFSGFALGVGCYTLGIFWIWILSFSLGNDDAKDQSVPR